MKNKQTATTATAATVTATAPTVTEQQWHLVAAQEHEAAAFKRYSAPVRELLALGSTDKCINTAVIAMALNTLGFTTQMTHSQHIGILGVIYKKDNVTLSSEAMRLAGGHYAERSKFEWAQTGNRAGSLFGQARKALTAYQGELGLAVLAYLAHKLGKVVDVKAVHADSVERFETTWFKTA